MFRILILLQIIVYLLIAPLVETFFFEKNGLLILWSVVALLSFAICAYQPTGSREHAGSSYNLRLSSLGIIALALLSLAYIFVVNDAGLTNRRQGSENMASSYASLSAGSLIILRVHEIILAPLILLCISGANTFREKIATSVPLLASFPFIGIIDSRGALLIIAISVIALIPAQKFARLKINKTITSLAIASIVGVFVSVSYARSLSYYNFRHFLHSEFISRLDGLSLTRRLWDTGNLNLLGNFDLGIFSPIILRFFPFSEAGKAYKAEGITSSKQYLLSDVLNSNEIDHANSMIADPAYFGGLFGVIVAFGFLGWLLRFVDVNVKRNRHLESPIKFTIYCSLAMSLCVFEGDFFGAISDFLLFIIVLAPLAVAGLRVVSGSRPVLK